MRKKLLIGFLILAILVALKQVIIVGEKEYMVIRSFTGKVSRIVSEAGPTLKLPLLETAYPLPKQIKEYDGAAQDILTADQKPVIVDHYVLWQITDPWAFVQNTRTVANAEQRLDAAVYSTVRQVMGRMKFSEIISEGESARGELDAEITRLVNESLAAGNYGITALDVRLRKIDLPEQNLNSVYARMRSERDKIAAEYLSQGEEESLRIKAETDREAAQLMAEATRRAKEIEAEGEAEAARIYNEVYGRNPEFYRMYRTLESYKTTLNNKPAIVIPIDSPYAKFLLGDG